MVFQKPTTIIVKNDMSSAAGIASFIFGIISIFFMAPVFVPLAVLFGIIAIICKQIIWATAGLLCALIGFLSSPILMGLFAITSVANVAVNHHPTNVQQTPTPTSPSQSWQAQQIKKDRDRAVIAVMEECKNKRLDGELKTYTASANCSNPQVIKIYQNSGYSYMDLIVLYTAKRLEIAEKLDKNDLTQAQAQLETAQFLTRLEDEALQRDKIKSR